MPIALRGPGDFFGEMALFEREVRMATVRAVGETKILMIDKKSYLQRILQDPALAFNVVQVMSRRIRQLSNQVAQLESLLGDYSQYPRKKDEK